MSEWMLGAAAALVLLVLLLVWWRQRRPAMAEAEVHFRRPGGLLNRSEAAFMELLKEATGDQFRIYPKVALGRLITPMAPAAQGQETEASWPAALAGEHADFVLCSKDDYAVIAVIALHSEPAAAQAEVGFDPVEDALAAAEISVARFNPKHQYTVSEVQKQLADSLSLPVKVFGQATHRLADTDASAAKSPHRGPGGHSLCPACGAAMVQRRANQGKFAGKLFWVCSRFPTCKKVLPVKG